MKIVIFSCALMLSTLLGQAQSLSDLYAKVNPSVVVIYTEGSEMLGGGSRLNKTSMQSLGSGVLIDADKGYIMTAAHVVHGAEKLRVVFNSGEDIPAKVVSSVPNADVALIKLDWKPMKEKVPAVKLGNSDNVRIGDDAFVIGAPLGLEHSLSKGVISGRHHLNKLSGKGAKLDFFQTDASINQGNSGGPMFNMKGEVIGLASSILTQSGGFEGIGFAATSNIAKHLLLDQGHFWSGLENIYLNEELCKSLNVPQTGALLVLKVVPVSLGGKLGLRGGNFNATIEGQPIMLGGDIILEVDGIALNNRENLEKLSDHLGELVPGALIKVKILREGKVQELKASLPVD